MKRIYFATMFFLVSVFILAGCGTSKNNESTGLFLFSKEILQKVESFTESYEDDVLSLKYPSNWKATTPIMGTKFIIIKEDYTFEPNTNMNIVEKKSEPMFKDASVDVIKKEFPKALNRMGITDIEFVKVEKALWQGYTGLYIEYTGEYKNQNMHYVQYYYDNGAKNVGVTFTVDEREWQMAKDDVQSIASSIVFKED